MELVKSYPRIGIVIIALILAIGAIVAGWLYMRPPAPELVVRNCIDACIAGDIDAVKDTMTSASAEDMQNWPGGEEIFILLMRRLAGGSAESLSILPASYEGADTAYVRLKTTNKYKLPAKTYTNLSIELVLLKEHGQWKIDADLTRKQIKCAIRSW